MDWRPPTHDTGKAIVNGDRRLALNGLSLALRLFKPT